jgi:hypothetical protein
MKTLKLIGRILLWILLSPILAAGILYGLILYGLLLVVADFIEAGIATYQFLKERCGEYENK